MKQVAKREREPIIKVCENCEDDFPINRPFQKYCSRRCCWEAWNKRHPRTGISKKTETVG